MKIKIPNLIFCHYYSRYTASKTVDTVTSSPAPAASMAPSASAKKVPGSTVSVASTLVGLYIWIYLLYWNCWIE